MVLRFVSVLGERYTHGHLYDFTRALREDPSVLVVLGDGRQRKSYLYVGDCIDAVVMLARPPRRRRHVAVFNLGTDEVSDVDTSIRGGLPPPGGGAAHRATPAGPAGGSATAR